MFKQIIVIQILVSKIHAAFKKTVALIDNLVWCLFYIIIFQYHLPKSIRLFEQYYVNFVGVNFIFYAKHKVTIIPNIV